MVVSMEDAWNFCCVVLPGSTDEDPLIVVPTSLQMGWYESPPFFCAATETACNIANELRTNATPYHRTCWSTYASHWLAPSPPFALTTVNV